MNIGVIFAGGIGRRMGNKALPKQFLKLHGKEIIIYTLEHFQNHPDIDGVVIACVADWIPYLKNIVKAYGIHKVRDIVSGGRTGQESIYYGLKAADKRYGTDNTIVLIHDGVRPLIEERTITECITCTKENRSAITVGPVVETIIRINEEQYVQDVIERSECLVARAPQTFYLEDILQAHNMALQDDKKNFIDSASLMKYYGYPLATIQGPVENIKITTPMDFYIFRALYEVRENSQLFGI